MSEERPRGVWLQYPDFHLAPLAPEYNASHLPAAVPWTQKLRVGLVHPTENLPCFQVLGRSSNLTYGVQEEMWSLTAPYYTYFSPVLQFSALLHNPGFESAWCLQCLHLFRNFLEQAGLHFLFTHTPNHKHSTARKRKPKSANYLLTFLFLSVCWHLSSTVVSLPFYLSSQVYKFSFSFKTTYF